MSTTAQVGGYQNFEDYDECGFVSSKPSEPRPMSPLHAAIDIVGGQRSLVRRLNELLEEPLTWRVRTKLRSIRLAQAKNVERCEALIAELTREHRGHSGVTPQRDGKAKGAAQRADGTA